MRVLGVTAASIASTSTRSLVSGTTTGMALLAQRGDPIDEEGMLAEQHLVAGPQIGVRQHRQQLVGAVAADDAGRVEAIGLADGLAQDLGAAFGIKSRSCDGLGEAPRPPWGWGPAALSLEESLNTCSTPAHAGAAADIGRDFENAGLGRGLHGSSMGSKKGRY